MSLLCLSFFCFFVFVLFDLFFVLRFMGLYLRFKPFFWVGVWGSTLGLFFLLESLLFRFFYCFCVFLFLFVR